VHKKLAANVLSWRPKVCPDPRSQIPGPVPVASPSPGQRHCRNSPSQAHSSISRTLWPSCTIAINLNRKLCVVWVERRRYRDDDMGWQWARWSHGLCKICTAFGAAQRALSFDWNFTYEWHTFCVKACQIYIRVEWLKVKPSFFVPVSSPLAVWQQLLNMYAKCDLHITFCETVCEVVENEERSEGSRALLLATAWYAF